MKFFDLHCDTITELYAASESLYNNNRHISIINAKKIEKYCQTFAIFIPDTLRGKAAADYFDSVCDYYEQQLDANKEHISAFEAKNDVRLNALLSVEGASAINASLEGVEHLHSRGVKLVTLTWNGDNEIASGCFSENDNGFTSFGRSAVKHMEQLGITIDVSHLSDKGFYELVSFASKPFIASHSCCRIVDNQYAQKRNLTDEQIKIIASCDGLVGINFCSDFLGAKKNKGKEAVFRHIAHALELGAEKSLAIGSDFDGCKVPKDLESISLVPTLYDYIISRGIDIKTADDIFYNNAYRFFENK